MIPLSLWFLFFPLFFFVFKKGLFERTSGWVADERSRAKVFSQRLLVLDELLCSFFSVFPFFCCQHDLFKLGSGHRIPNKANTENG